jgi:hypothetical protein
VTVTVRPLGSVLPLGILTFGIGAAVTAALSLGWLPVSESRSAYMVLLTFVVPIQAIAAVFAFLSRDTPGGTILSLYGATWAALAVAGLTHPAGTTSSAVGLPGRRRCRDRAALRRGARRQPGLHRDPGRLVRPVPPQRRLRADR